MAAIGVSLALICGMGVSFSSSGASPKTTPSSLPPSGPGKGTGTVRVGVACSTTGIEPMPECLTTFDAMAAYANSKGGINGYKIVIDNCYLGTSLLNPSLTEKCATKEVTETHDQLLLGRNGGLGVMSVLDAHDVPCLGCVDVEPTFDTAPMSFIYYGWQPDSWVSLIKYSHSNGYTHPAYTTTETTIGSAATAAIKAEYKNLHTTPKSVDAELTAVSFTAQVELLKSEGVDIVYPVLADPSIVTMVKEADAIGYHPAFATDWDSIDQRVEKILAPIGTSNILFSTAPFKTYGVVGSLEKSTVAKYEPSGRTWEWSFVSIWNWIGMEFLFQALEHMSGPATSAKLVAQLRKDTFTSEWLPHSVNWRHTGIGHKYCQIAENTTYIYKLEKGVWKQIGGPYNDPPPFVVTGCGKV